MSIYEARYATRDLAFYRTQEDQWFDDLEEAEGYAENTSLYGEALIGIYDMEEPHEEGNEWPNSIAIYAYGTRYSRDD